MTLLRKLVSTERAHANRLECGCAAGAKKEQQLQANRRGKNQLGNHQPVACKETLQKQGTMVATVAAKKIEWHEMRTGQQRR